MWRQQPIELMASLHGFFTTDWTEGFAVADFFTTDWTDWADGFAVRFFLQLIRLIGLMALRCGICYN